MKQLRAHQKSATNAIAKTVKGVINHPTGTGKSLIQSRSIVNGIASCKGQMKVCVILSPRILLSNQLLEDVRTDLMHNKTDSRYLVVHSGRDDVEGDDMLRIEMGLEYRQTPTTLRSGDVMVEYLKAQNENVPLIISSTYHSAERIVQSGVPVDVVYCDEAHYLVQEQFHWIATDQFPSNNKFFFTATLRETPSTMGMGMNNTEDFGKVISQELPVDMIQSGDLVRPRIHIVSATGYDDDSMDGSVVAEAFNEHNSLTKVGAKMLVVAKGCDHLNAIVRHNSIQELQYTHPQLKIFDISAVPNGYGPRINGQVVTRKQFLTDLRNLKDADEAIIVHIDILTEGVDVPGITGIMPLNGQGKAKFLQTLGRATRLHPTDRERLWSGQVVPSDTKKLIKPYAWVIIPAYGVLGDDLTANIQDIVTELRSFGFNPSEDVVIKQKRGKSVPVPLDTVTEPDRSVQQLTEFMGRVMHDIEDEETANLLKLQGVRAKERANTRSVNEIILDSMKIF